MFRYWAGRGFCAHLLSGGLSLAALGFTVALSGFLLLGLDWGGLLSARCLVEVRAIVR